MLNKNMPPEVAKKLWLYMTFLGIAILVAGLILAFVAGIEEFKLTGYIFIPLGLFDIILGHILFKPDNRI